MEESTDQMLSEVIRRRFPISIIRILLTATTICDAFALDESHKSQVTKKSLQNSREINDNQKSRLSMRYLNYKLVQAPFSKVFPNLAVNFPIELHYTYNRNLVDEEDQELTNHLSRRSLNAQRMTTLASATYRNANNKSSDDPNVDLPGQVNQARGRSVTFDPLSSSIVLRQRHARSSMLQRQRVRSASEGEPVILEEHKENSTQDSTILDMESKENNSRERSSPASPQNEEIPLLEILSGNLTSADSEPKEEV